MDESDFELSSENPIYTFVVYFPNNKPAFSCQIREDEDGKEFYFCYTNSQWFEISESLYEIVDEEHSGTKDDPIPWRKNMQCYKDKYYIQNEIVYKCTRDSGNALQNDIIDLIGHYFEVA